MVLGAYVFRLWRTGIGADDKSRQRANQFLTFSKKLLTNRLPCDIITARCMAVDSHAMLHGGIAQLGERLNGIQEVRGSTPLISTIKTHAKGAYKTPTRVSFSMQNRGKLPFLW